MRCVRLNLCSLVLCLGVFASGIQAAPITGGTGPGGIGLTGPTGDLVLWVRGDAGIVFGSGTNVAAWNDQGGRNNNFTQGTAANQPDQVTTLNGVPVVSFVGANSDRLQNLAVTGLANLSGVTVVGLYDSDVVGTPDVFFMSSQTAANVPTFPHVENYNTNGGYRWLTAGYNNVWRYGAGSTVDGSSQTYVGTLDGSQVVDANRLTMRVDGTSYTPTIGSGGTIAATNDNATRVFLGSWITNGTYNMTGKIGETAIYNTALSTAAQTIVENYLSAKFDSSPLATDHYSGDTGANGNFDFGVFGVGNDGTSSVLNAGFDGMGIQIGSAASGDWVFAGHTNGSNGVTTNNIPGGERWERSWFVDTTGITTANLAFDWNDAGITSAFDASFNALYYRPLNSGSFSLVGFGTVDIGNQRVDFSGVNLPVGDGYFTLGSVLPAPEPASLTIFGVGATGLVCRSKHRRKASEHSSC